MGLQSLRLDSVNALIMECLIPLDANIPSKNYELIKTSHEGRKFIVFDEQLKICLYPYHKKQSKTRLVAFKVWINDVLMLKSEGWQFFHRVSGETFWELDPDVCSENLFRSTVVMNNGYDNYIRFEFTFEPVLDDVVPSKQEIGSEDDPGAPNAVDGLLTSFEPAFYWLDKGGDSQQDERRSSLRIHPPDSGSPLAVTPHDIVTLEFPIYSLLNMGLKNSLLPSRNFIISSLDFQTSRAASQLLDKHVCEQTKSGDLELQFSQILYELIDRKAHLPLDPIVPLKTPFIAHSFDSFSIGYKLPLPGPYSSAGSIGSNSNSGSSGNYNNNFPYRVRIKLIYKVVLRAPEGRISLPVVSSWETDVILRKPVSRLDYMNRVLTMPVPSSPRFNNPPRNFTYNNIYGQLFAGGSLYQNSLRNLLGNGNNNSTSSLISARMNSVKFKFLESNLIVEKGNEFTMKLQIVNLSNVPLDFVIYCYNNKNTKSGSLNVYGASGSTLNLSSGDATGGMGSGTSSNSTVLDKQYQHYKKLHMASEGIILLSNDYKVPIIQPNETYIVDLRFIGIMSGYYPTLPGLKTLELQSSEIVEVGSEVSVVVH